MAKKKLIHFQENLTFPHLFQPTYLERNDDFILKGNWNENFFKNPNPITLELGCGKGEYTVGLAEKHPGRNFVGIDLKGARLWRGCKTVAENAMRNVAFIRSRIDHVERFFGAGEVTEIWITFPDPQPGKARKRLTSPVFLNRYKSFLSPENIIHLKTDDESFFHYTLETIESENHNLLLCIEDLYSTDYQGDASAFRTFYESMWLEQGKKISYLQFRI